MRVRSFLIRRLIFLRRLTVDLWAPIGVCSPEFAFRELAWGCRAGVPLAAILQQAEQPFAFVAIADFFDQQHFTAIMVVDFVQ